MRKYLISGFLLLSVCALLPGCGGSSSSTSTHTSGIANRAFISNSVSSPTSVAGLVIVNAQTDVRPPGVAPISAGNTPGMMVVTPNRAYTLVFSGTNTQSSDNQFTIVNNTGETTAGHVALPGYTESFVASPDSSTAYVAVPTATVEGQSPGNIEVVGVSTGAFTGEIDIPSVHYLAINNGGNRLLAFTDVPASLYGQSCDQTPAFVFVVTPSDVGVTPCPATPIPGFDYPVQAYFSSDDTTAYVLNCGPECGGMTASVQPLDMTTPIPTPGTAAPVPAATEALIIGSTMYLAGTPYSGGAPSQPCTGQTTAAKTCGLLTIFDLDSMSIVNTSPIVITDGYHNRIAMGPNGQLFIGARTCTEIVPPLNPPPGTEVRGCLSIYNSSSAAVGSAAPGGVVIPPANGDATGIQPISQRTVVYVVQGGSLSVYDATIDALEYNPNDPNNPGQIFGLIGDFVDVKTVDF